ncbi:MAG TPA: hypothetical protein P5330_09705 [Candidatus Competibacteraceae bacterium]|nr:hypothetical protein [Candidatus Competibacteraceae bacterium]
MVTEIPTPGDRPPTRTIPNRPIVPAALWRVLTPGQRQQVRETFATVCREWWVTLNPRETSRNE